jgi:hypothetical protein
MMCVMTTRLGLGLGSAIIAASLFSCTREKPMLIEVSNQVSDASESAEKSHVNHSGLPATAIKSDERLKNQELPTEPDRRLAMVQVMGGFIQKSQWRGLELVTFYPTEYGVESGLTPSSNTPSGSINGGDSNTKNNTVSSSSASSSTGPVDELRYMIVVSKATRKPPSVNVCEHIDSSENWQLPSEDDLRWTVAHGLKFNEIPIGVYQNRTKSLFALWGDTSGMNSPLNSNPNPTASAEALVVSDADQQLTKSIDAYVTDFDKALLSLESRIKGKSQRQLQAFYAKNPGLESNIPLIRSAKDRLAAKEFAVVCFYNP